MAYTVVGLFETKEQTETAVKQLVSAGVDNSLIDVSTYRADGDYDQHDYDYDRDEKNEGFWDWLFGDDDDEKSSYSRVGARSHLVTVYAGDMSEAESASRILDTYGAMDVKECDARINQSNYATAQNSLHSSDTTSNTNFANNETINSDETLEVIEEDLQVGKKEVTDGHVKLKSRIVEKPVQESVRLKEERVYVKRKPVNRTATESDFHAFKEGEMEMRESHEEAVVNKTAKVVEEVSLEKEVDVETEQINETVRETKVEVEKVEANKKKGLTGGNC